jgi:hypothetical protein
MNRIGTPAAAWSRLKEALTLKGVELAECLLLGWLEPQPLSSCYDDELQRARQGIHRAKDGDLARFRKFVNRNAFLLACGDYTEDRREEHVFIGYGYRHGATTRVTGLHHAAGNSHAVHIPRHMAHAMWDHYSRRRDNEILIFHNHPYSPLNFLFNNPPLPSPSDRHQLERLALNREQLLRTLLGEGRVLFYLGENGAVRQFRLPRALVS